MPGAIDLRSDTATKPTPEMRRAMFDAEVGDDTFGEDPTVRALEERAAELLGKESAMLVLSSTMGNIVSVLSHTARGQSVVIEETAHININEAGQLATVCGVTPRPVKGSRGYIEPRQLESAVFPKSTLHPETRLVCIENTHNAAGGRCLSVEQTQALCRTARTLGLAVHLDGARIFNAAIALGVPANELTRDVDSVTLSLTKGLGCPVGSLVAGTEEFIGDARHWRQMVGGGMKQAGCFAAAGLVAFQTMIDRLVDDHANAKLLATRLADLGLAIKPDDVETNIVFLEIPKTLMDAQAFVELLRAEGVIVNRPRGNRIRFVTHHDVDSCDVELAIQRLSRVLEARTERTHRTGTVASSH